jgi:hypothetical protein
MLDLLFKSLGPSSLGLFAPTGFMNFHVYDNAVLEKPRGFRRLPIIRNYYLLFEAPRIAFQITDTDNHPLTYSKEG